MAIVNDGVLGVKTASTSDRVWHLETVALREAGLTVEGVQLPVGQAPAHRFAAERLAQLARIERDHFWFVGRRLLIADLLTRYLARKERPVLDLGCGTGYFLRDLASRGYRMVGLDERPEGLQATRQQLPQAVLVEGDATNLPFQENTFGAALLLDLLEHTDDRAVLSEVYRILEPGGVAIVSVPAFAWLWSYRDEAAGHRRRYSRYALTTLIAGAHLQLEEIRYYQCLLFPLVVVTRLFGRRGAGMRDLEEQPRHGMNAVLARINKIEARLGARVRWPWGSSLIAVCRKP